MNFGVACLQINDETPVKKRKPICMFFRPKNVVLFTRLSLFPHRNITR